MQNQKKAVKIFWKQDEERWFEELDTGYSESCDTEGNIDLN